MMVPVFIIGTERSGTNLMRLILNSHPNIFVPHPPHIMKNFVKYSHLYGDTSNDDNFMRLIRDVVKMVELHPYPWEIKLDKEKILKEVWERNLINIYFAIYNQYLQYSGKKRWGCKSTFMIYFVSQILKYYPDAKYIYMVRDGRDVAVSARKSIFNHYHPYYIAHLWKREQQIGIYWLNKLPKTSIHLVRYEELISSPTETIVALCSFLEEPFDSRMLDYASTEEAKKSGSLSESWQNTSKPLIGDNIKKYKQNLNSMEIALFEAIAAPELDYFSYQLENDFWVSELKRAVDCKWKITYFIVEKLLMLITQLRALFKDKNNLLRYRKYWFLKKVSLIRRIG